MSLLKGETLAARLRSSCDEFRHEIASGKRGPLAKNEIIAVSTQVASALLAAHSSGPETDTGIIHRDVKPGNIWIKNTARHEELRVVLLDFGLAKQFDVPGTETGMVMGTPLYMSPEQADGVCNPGPESDLFSLGTVMYEMCTGRNPFGEPGDDELAVLRRVRESRVPAINIEDIPGSLKELIRDLHEKTAKRRPGAQEVLRRLQKISEEPVTTKVIGVAPEVVKRNFRRRTVLSLIGGIVLGGIGALVFPDISKHTAALQAAPTLQYFPEGTVDGRPSDSFQVNPPKPLGNGAVLEAGSNGSLRIKRQAGETFEPFFGVVLTVRPGGEHDSWNVYRDGVLEVMFTAGSSSQTLSVKPECFPKQTPTGIQLPTADASPQTVRIPVAKLLALVESDDVNQLTIEAEDTDKEQASFFELKRVVLQASSNEP